MKTKIYIVQANGGMWDDSWTSNVKAFKTLEKAEEYVKECKENVPEYSEYFEMLLMRIGEFAHFRAAHLAEDEYYNEYEGVNDAMRAKAHKKYPRYTEDRDEENVWFGIDEVEMEEC